MRMILDPKYSLQLVAEKKNLVFSQIWKKKTYRSAQIFIS